MEEMVSTHMDQYQVLQHQQQMMGGLSGKWGRRNHGLRNAALYITMLYSSIVLSFILATIMVGYESENMYWDTPRENYMASYSFTVWIR